MAVGHIAHKTTHYSIITSVDKNKLARHCLHPR